MESFSTRLEAHGKIFHFDLPRKFRVFQRAWWMLPVWSFLVGETVRCTSGQPFAI
ncbi:hypothetical protein LOAG_02684 [Loa loa]|uniref:Uncharacterized protein n=1 Tax=Loa loa TaxID=7209 RepID=A0A1S0U639_LOALO|nr:hypothetical protein LOAG_02684 [Loa loa]EFO25801.1 hypothetical protein LOAG_02684 [Loa loa]